MGKWQPSLVFLSHVLPHVEFLGMTSIHKGADQTDAFPHDHVNAGLVPRRISATRYTQKRQE